ncbi:hypothetical protein niasHT_004009 [Heterodera trifolii]|uniref:DNA2/NAM7 helicase-like C-terminal domain-containing protein n=1 Tax=Heterodera trifolii TaxID=157864 RepID=A0ABD2M4A5_9BILA
MPKKSHRKRPQTANDPAPTKPAKIPSPNSSPHSVPASEISPSVEQHCQDQTTENSDQPTEKQQSEHVPNIVPMDCEVVVETTETGGGGFGSKEPKAVKENESARKGVPFEAFKLKGGEEFANSGFANSGFEKSIASDEEDENTKNSKIYVVIQQMVEDRVTAAPVGEPGEWPYFVSISDSIIKGFRKLKLGDLVEVVSYEWREDFRQLSGSEGGNARFWIHNGIINAQAVVTVCAPNPPQQPTHQPGIVIEVRYDNKKKRMQSIVVASPGLHPSQRLFKRQFGAEFDEEIQPGMVVMVGKVQLTRPSNFKVSQLYILPEKSPFFSGGERSVFNPIVAVELNKAPFNYEFPFPPSLPKIRFSEGVLAAAISACTDRLEADLSNFTIITVPEVTHSTTHSFTAWIYQWLETKKQLVDYAKRWEEDQPLQMKLSKADKAKPCGHGFIIENWREKLETGFYLKIKISMYYQDAKKYDAYEDFLRIRDGGDEGEFRPMQSLDSLNKREFRFVGRTFSDWASGDMDDARIGQALLGLGEKLPVQGLTWDKLTQRHPALSSLCEGQQQTALYMMDPIRRLVFMQAPPGTGKTYCSATIAAAILSEDPDATVLCVAPLNIATARLCEEMQKALQKAGSEIPLLALFSGNGKYRYAVHLQKISKHLLATAVSGPELQEALKDGPEKKKLSRYLEQCAANPRQTDEGTVAKIFLGIEKRRALFCTLSLGEQIAPIFQDFSHIILDEAGQAPYSQLLSFLSLFSSIKKVLVTGDKYQLHVNMMELPPAVHHGFGLDTAIINFDNSLSVDSTTLTTSFRSHPFITKCIEAGAYADKGEKIAAGRTEDEMTLFTKNNNFKLPVKDSPLLFMHITDQMEQEETSFSSTNPRQTDATIALLHTLVPHFQGTIRVVCLYAGQTADIAQRCNEESIEEVIVTTADSTQGYEADLTIVTTTLSGRSEQVGFWAEEARVNVALSRSRHGLILIGGHPGIFGLFHRHKLVKWLFSPRPNNMPKVLYYTVNSVAEEWPSIIDRFKAQFSEASFRVCFSIFFTPSPLIDFVVPFELTNKLTGEHLALLHYDEQQDDEEGFVLNRWPIAQDEKNGEELTLGWNEIDIYIGDYDVDEGLLDASPGPSDQHQKEVNE